MSQASKHVDWCLQKARKEIEECKKLEKRPKHRGLLRVEPSKKDSEKHIDKAIENLEIANLFDEKKLGYVVIGSLFYSMYHCFLAIASKFGYESVNQTCTIYLIEHLKEKNEIKLDNKFIEMMKYKEDQKYKEFISIIEMREDYTYSAKMSVEKEQIDELMKECKELIEATKNIIHSSPQ